MTQALLMSSSKVGALGYLEHAHEQIHALLNSGKQQVLFIPYAAVSFSYDEYLQKVQPVFESLGYGVRSIHQFSDPLKAVQEAQVIAVGGGNTFALLKRLYENNLLGQIAKRVKHENLPYIGWSAGSNIAAPSIRTTNDMPIVQPPSFAALQLVPFQINPHFIAGKPVDHNGESREDRLNEFLAINPQKVVLALYEGSALLVKNDEGTILGDRNALCFKAVDQIVEISANQTFKLASI